MKVSFIHRACFDSGSFPLDPQIQNLRILCSKVSLILKYCHDHSIQTIQHCFHSELTSLIKYFIKKSTYFLLFMIIQYHLNVKKKSHQFILISHEDLSLELKVKSLGIKLLLIHVSLSELNICFRNLFQSKILFFFTNKAF